MSKETSSGCIVRLLFLAIVTYYAVAVGSVYVGYLRLRETMSAQARLASGLTDAVIRRRLISRVQELRIPGEATRFVIRRREQPREITITTKWEQAIDLPFYTWVVSFRPTVRALL